MVSESGFPPTRVRRNDFYAVYWGTEHYSKNELLKNRINITLKLQSKGTEFCAQVPLSNQRAMFVDD